MNRLTNQVSVNGYNVSYTYTATSQRATMMDASGATAYSYDNRDRLLLKTVSWNNGQVVSLNYLYDANGNVTNVWSSTTNGVSLAYSYDPLSWLINVVGQASSLSQYAYDAVGNLQTMSYGNGYRVDHGRFVIEGLGHDHIAALTHRDVRVERDIRNS
jgi:YD repeat-containing protein